MLVVLTVILTALSGCYRTLPGSQDLPPTIGACYDLVFGPEIDSVSNSNPAVSCDDSHTVQTFFVASVTGQYASWSTRPIPEILWSLQYDLCPVDNLRHFLGAGERDSVSQVAIKAYFPTASAWQSGARSVSCVVSVNGPSGMLPVNRDLRNVMYSADSADLRTCYVQSPAPTGGWSLTGREVTCAAAHSSQDINAWLQVDRANPAPGLVQTMCAPYAEQFIGPDWASSGLTATGVVVPQSNGSFSLHCAVGGDPVNGYTSTVLLAHR